MLFLVDFGRVAAIWFLLGFSHRVCVSSVVSVSNQRTNWLSLGKYNRETSLAPKKLVVQVAAATALAPSADLRQARRRTQTSSTAGERFGINTARRPRIPAENAASPSRCGPST
jgi:hypothetical protein